MIFFKGKIYQSFLVFLLVFSFKLPLLYNSALAVFIISILMFLISVNKIKLSKNDVFIPFFYVILAILIVVYASLHESFDFSRLNSIYVNLFIYTTALLTFSKYRKHTSHNEENNFLDFANILFLAFFIQAVIIFLAFLFPHILDLIRLFQSETDSVRSESYGGIRGLALSSAQFFPLSAAFAIVQPILAYSIIKEDRYKLIKVIFFIFIVLAGLTAGRTTLIGTSASLFLFFICFIRRINLKYFLKSIINISLLSGMMIVLFIFLNSSSLIEKIPVVETYINFAFEFLINYQTEGSLSTSSTDILTRMYWALDPYYFLVGYGEYTMPDGSQFMSTDGGYMRNILFFGIIGAAAIFIFNALIFYIIYRNVRFDREAKYTIVVLWLLTNILHYKGEILLHLVSVQTIIFLLYVYTQKKKLKENINVITSNTI